MKNFKVLLIDPNKLEYLTSHGDLKELNCFVDFCNNDKEALELYSKNDYDLVLIDVQNKKYNGIKLVKNLRGIDYTHSKNFIPILGLGTDISNKMMQKSQKNGVNFFIDKPIDPKEVKIILSDEIFERKK